jgi:G3E family GTPase
MSTLGSKDVRIPVNVLTGCLGSGKTTLLKRLLDSPTFTHCAVLINELGEIGMDHQLLGPAEQEMVLLQNGCICCGIRDDLVRALQNLHERHAQEIQPLFNRVIIETTGLADPVSLLHVIINNQVLRHHFRVGTVVATVDAVNGIQQLGNQPEAVRQVAVADRVVVSKADMVDATQVEALCNALRQINASARLVVSHNDATETDVLLTQDADTAHRAQEIRQWFYTKAAAIPDACPQPLFGMAARRLGPIHQTGITTVSLVIEQPVDWIAFGVWLSMLLHSHGDAILRVKGILNVQGADLPTVVHGVRNLIHPPMHLSAWPSADHRSRLILIGHLPTASQLRESLELFNAKGDLALNIE